MKERHSDMINLELIMKSINTYTMMKTKKSKAILDATKINPVNLDGERVIGFQNHNKNV
jgi:hypothetical protein